MLKIAAAVLALVLTAAASGAQADPPARGDTFKITNATDRIVECTLLVDGMTRTYLRVHPGKAYQDGFRANRILQLVCIRGKEGVFGPLKLGMDYQFERDGDRVTVVAGS